MTDALIEASSAPPAPRNWGENLPARHPEGTRLWGENGTAATAGRLYMTGDLRAATGLPRTHLDFYLREGIVRPTARTESGYLLFDEAELATLRTVLRWRREGIGIRQIRERLRR